jgi:hypothetical protein
MESQSHPATTIPAATATGDKASVRLRGVHQGRRGGVQSSGDLDGTATRQLRYDRDGVRYRCSGGASGSAGCLGVRGFGDRLVRHGDGGRMPRSAADKDCGAEHGGIGSGIAEFPEDRRRLPPHVLAIGARCDKNMKAFGGRWYIEDPPWMRSTDRRWWMATPRGWVQADSNMGGTRCSTAVESDPGRLATCASFGSCGRFNGWTQSAARGLQGRRTESAPLKHGTRQTPFRLSPFFRSRNSRPTFTIGTPSYSTMSAVA